MSEIALYGIANCDTVRKARRSLDAAGVGYRFVDVRKDGLAADRLRGWVDAVGWETLVNRRGTTWRQLPDDQREGLDAERAIALMLEHPALIKRPVIEQDDAITVGWTPETAARWGAA
ncbi:MULTISPECIES: ArsC family reductase [unclassified Thioalkalivibrio]|uniref:ArsC family reductase n=1 Tax=unclassified Thioalkalivibrio TaxID=2621013 RepID=UPI000374F574|nr:MULTISPECIES: ArsC family reductase [unclassified Thioalkalivibrio]